MGEISEGDQECTCDEHWVLYGTAEALHCTPETNVTLDVNQTGIFLKISNGGQKVETSYKINDKCGFL